MRRLCVRAKVRCDRPPVRVRYYYHSGIVGKYYYVSERRSESEAVHMCREYSSASVHSGWPDAMRWDYKDGEVMGWLVRQVK